MTVRVVDTEAEIKKVWDEMWKEIEEKRMRGIESAPTPEIRQNMLEELQVGKKAFYEKVKQSIPEK